jgi:hypothetical protein
MDLDLNAEEILSPDTDGEAFTTAVFLKNKQLLRNSSCGVEFRSKLMKEKEQEFQRQREEFLE